MTTEDAAPRPLVCIPTYDEAEALPVLIERIRALHPELDLLVIDDGSPDGTGAIVSRLGRTDPHLHLLQRTAKAGLGAAYLAGFAWGVERGFTHLVEMDADGSHRPEDLQALLDAAGAGADLVIGTRWMPGGRTVNWPLRRQVLSRAANTYARLALGVPLHDLTGGFRVYRAEALTALELQTVTSQGYCFQVELALRAYNRRQRITEVPITFVERMQGASKMSRDVVVEAILRITRWGLGRRTYRVRTGHSARLQPDAR